MLLHLAQSKSASSRSARSSPWSDRHYAEINEEFTRMLKAVAKEGAKSMWRSMLCQTEEQAVGILH
jgi:hypothetical protein